MASKSNQGNQPNSMPAPQNKPNQPTQNAQNKPGGDPLANIPTNTNTSTQNNQIPANNNPQNKSGKQPGALYESKAMGIQPNPNDLHFDKNKVMSFTEDEIRNAFKVDELDEIDKELADSTQRISDKVNSKIDEQQLLKAIETSLMDLSHDRGGNAKQMLGHYLLDKSSE